MKKYIFYLLMIGISLIIIISFYSNNDQNEKSNSNNTREGMGLNSNTIQIGLLDTNGKLIDNGSKLLEKKNKLDYTISIDNFIDNESEYKLIVLADFQQVSFTVSGEEFITYDFNIGANESKNIETRIDYKEPINEIVYLLIKEPNFLFKPEEITPEVMEAAGYLEQILTLRFSVDNGSKNIDFSNKFLENNSIPIVEAYLSANSSVLDPVFEKKSGEKLKLSIGNVLDEELELAVIQFVNWDQLEFEKGKDVEYLKVEPGKVYTKDIELPKVEKEKNYQVIAFYKPYSVSPSDYNSLFTFGTYRLVISPR
ncbi:hypothetical protein CIL03_06465 [Virgibacillus indicus]|uniref:Uncharacterized protein n=1 Tax=Virgibacillus indicus TaxID=2024554 RepID=A0A265ND08_9BACI|nr:hypothetical protein [Virgibacillus indicus]OZU89354.1 hypothetical protein CIL03_06465 [Virgibacillus indicus]